MILNYTEASAYAVQIAQYLMLCTLGPLIFVWAWRNLVTYFKWTFEDENDETVDLLEDIRDEITELRSTIENDTRQVELEIRR